jgi:hypothetical protein
VPIGIRTRFSLAQYLDRQSRSCLEVLFAKYGVLEAWLQWRDFGSDTLQALAGFLQDAKQEEWVHALVAEVVATEPDLYYRAVNQWGDGRAAYASRWHDLVQCLTLDGYAVSDGRLVPLEPNLEGASHVEDALRAEIFRSRLPKALGIIDLLEQSANAFRQASPNYNACLSNVRCALQSLATDIAQAQQAKNGGSFQADKWGQVMAYLRTSALVTEAEENLACAVYTFISTGAHQPVGLSQEEMVRLGRGMAISISYFLVKLHNG